MSLDIILAVIMLVSGKILSEFHGQAVEFDRVGRIILVPEFEPYSGNFVEGVLTFDSSCRLGLGLECRSILDKGNSYGTSLGSLRRKVEDRETSGNYDKSPGCRTDIKFLVKRIVKSI